MRWHRQLERGNGETVGLPALGKEGDTCEQCGSVLATDQRYCLNCGWRRGESRVDYEKRLNGGIAASNGAVAAAPPANQQWTPAFAILAIALLGVMLLLGVLIGKKGNDSTQTVAAQAAPDHHRRGGGADQHHGDDREQQQGQGGCRNRARIGQRDSGR